MKIEKTCTICGASYQTYRPGSRTCSRPCYHRSRLLHQKPKPGEYKYIYIDKGGRKHRTIRKWKLGYRLGRGKYHRLPSTLQKQVDAAKRRHANPNCQPVYGVMSTGTRPRVVIMRWDAKTENNEPII
jgi:hypothetical protein